GSLRCPRGALLPSSKSGRDSTMNQTAIDLARAVPLSDVIHARGIHLKRQGNEWVGPCPTHGGRDRFAVNHKKVRWNCRGSEGGADSISLIRHIDQCSFHIAVQILARLDHRPIRAAANPVSAEDDKLKEDEERQIGEPTTDCAAPMNGLV